VPVLSFDFVRSRRRKKKITIFRRMSGSFERFGSSVAVRYGRAGQGRENKIESFYTFCVLCGAWCGVVCSV
jgi:hypothetical protein